MKRNIKLTFRRSKVRFCHQNGDLCSLVADNLGSSEVKLALNTIVLDPWVMIHAVGHWLSCLVNSKAETGKQRGSGKTKNREKGKTGKPRGTEMARHNTESIRSPAVDTQTASAISPSLLSSGWLNQPAHSGLHGYKFSDQLPPQFLIPTSSLPNSTLLVSCNSTSWWKEPLLTLQRAVKEHTTYGRISATTNL
jgi:hypothetical protein